VSSTNAEGWKKLFDRDGKSNAEQAGSGSIPTRSDMLVVFSTQAGRSGSCSYIT